MVKIGKESQPESLRLFKAVIFCDSNYATDKETRNSVSGIVATIGGTLLIFLSKYQRTIMIISTEAEYL